MHIELHSTTGCDTIDCYWVEVYSNMKPLDFVGVCANPRKCTYSEFQDVLKTRSFVQTSSHYEVECSETWSPPGFSAITPIEQQLIKERASHFVQKYRL